MNKAQQEINKQMRGRIDKITFGYFNPYSETEVRSMIEEGILLGLKEGRKEVLEEIEYRFKDDLDSPIIKIDESEWENLKKKVEEK